MTLSTFPHSLFFLLASFVSPPASVCPSVTCRQGYSPGITCSPPSPAANRLISLNISTQISMPPAPVCSVSLPGSILAAHFPQWVYLKLCFFSYLLIMSFSSATEIPATGHVCTYLQDLHLLMWKLRSSVSVDSCHLFAHWLSCHDSLTWTSLALVPHPPPIPVIVHNTHFKLLCVFLCPSGPWVKLKSLNITIRF